MQDIPTQDDTMSHEYQEGFERIMYFHEQARERGWKVTERQLVREIIHRERAALIREKSSLPIVSHVGQPAHSAAWNRGQADALRALLRALRLRQPDVS